VREWIVVEEEAGDSKPYTPLPLTFEDASRLRENLTFKESWLEQTKGIIPKKTYSVVKLNEYINDPIHTR
jgi:hypothetical protein